MQKVKRFFPFLRWFPLRRETLKADWIAGLTGGLVLVPQAMAYAQLAGLPPQYGLYTALLPGVVAALWGSSSKLSSGPVALVSILTGSALAPLAIAGSEKFIALAILLALLVGIVQLALGIFKLGVVINFISHPVIIGFTNAAAIIIALSQLNKLLGLPLGRSEHFAQDIWEVLSQVRESHIPSLLMGLSAFAIMLALKKYYPKLPGVLVAVVIATAVSWAIGFERIKTLPIDRIMDPQVRQQAEEVVTLEKQISRTNGQIVDNSNQLANLPKSQQASPYDASLTYGIQLLRIDLKNLELERRAEYRALRKHSFELVPATAMAPARLYVLGQAPAGIQSDGVRWHVKAIVVGDELKLVGGGEVVGTVPPGLPSFELPDMNWNAITTLISSALVISLVGFMEAISIAKAMATKSKERLDPNQELIGQGLANIVGSFTQSFPSSGSFARSAINFNAGAVTGFSTVFAAVVVLVTLLFLTPLLYHLPQAVLAAVIMLAVVNLVNFKSMVHAWRAHRHDGIAAAVTFIASLAFAPHLDSGILAGAGLAVILFLLRTMKPRIVTLGRHADGTLRDAKIHNLPQSEHIVVIRFDAALYFANAPYFEDAVLEASASHPKVKFIIILGDGMNQLDASGEEVIRHLTTRLRQNAITLVFVGLKRQVLQVMQRTRLYPSIGAQNFFRTEREALEAIYQWIGEEESFDAKYCPLTPAREPELDKVGAALNPGSQAQTSEPAATLTAEPTSVSAQESAPSRAKSA